MADEGELDKSEQPTPFKLTKARTKGTVARSTDLGFLTALATLFVYAWIAGPKLGNTLMRVLHDALSGGPKLADGNDAVLQAAILLFSSAAVPVALLAVVVFAVVLLFEVVQTGVVFSAEPLKPDFSKLNPAKGLKRIFTIRLLIETGKQILKLCTYTATGYLIIRGALSSDLGVVTDGLTFASVLLHVTLRLLGAFVLVAVVFAAIDQLIVRRDFLKRMRMSRREVRREARDREGDPRLKQKRKQLHAEFTKASQSLRNIRKADVIIANPQHIAVALRYDAKTMQAPLVVSVGTNQFAQRLKRLAFVYGIPVVENRLLARALLAKANLNSPIPEAAFGAVAAIYNTIRKNAATRSA